uniref:Uncharacterized protein n=1 Tax=Strongyloides venezuelensis TaxID=75913 RepID=A0A0K0FSR9_STRVS
MDKKSENLLQVKSFHFLLDSIKSRIESIEKDVVKFEFAANEIEEKIDNMVVKQLLNNNPTLRICRVIDDNFKILESSWFDKSTRKVVGSKKLEEANKKNK